MEILRTKYLKELINVKDTHFIKVVTGVRRCGKSTLLAQYINELKKSGVKKEQIIIYDFNDKLLAKKKWEDLLNEIIKKSISKKTNYVFLDEIQEIKEFEKCVITLFEHKKIRFDIYITGSNSNMFSSQLSTLFTGRYREIKMLPLSFKEYFEFYKKNYVKGEYDTRKIFNLYLKYGALPILLDCLDNELEMSKRLTGILNDTINKDVKFRHSIRNMSEFNRIVKYVFEEIGHKISVLNIETFMRKVEKTKIVYKTIDRYLTWLCEALLMYKTDFWDVKGKKILESSTKFYPVDLGIRNSLDKFNSWSSGFCLESLVFIELKRRFDENVYVGKLRNGEVDFICVDNKDQRFYFQVTKTLKDGEDKKLWKREVGNLEEIRDSFPKIVLSLEDETKILDSGIKIINLIEWLLNKERIMF